MPTAEPPHDARSQRDRLESEIAHLRHQLGGVPQSWRAPRGFWAGVLVGGVIGLAGVVAVVAMVLTMVGSALSATGPPRDLPVLPVLPASSPEGGAR